MPKRLDLAGRRFGRLLAISPETGPGALWRCICDCGGALSWPAGQLNANRKLSCGCIDTGRRKLGRIGGPALPKAIYTIWDGMLSRCLDPTRHDYDRYGGRGVKVCDRWLQYENFRADMGPRPAGTSLDRYPNNDGDYEPGNCRWATDVDQNRNKRNNRLAELNGRSQCVAAWCEEFGIRRAAVYSRLDLGWPLDKALTTPIRQTHSNRAAR